MSSVLNEQLCGCEGTIKSQCELIGELYDHGIELLQTCELWRRRAEAAESKVEVLHAVFEHIIRECNAINKGLVAVAIAKAALVRSKDLAAFETPEPSPVDDEQH